MPRHLFLSDEWIDEVRAIQASADVSSIDAEGMIVNATITDVPFGDGTLERHSDHGPMLGWQPGHSADTTVSIVVDYHTARALVLDSSDDMSVLDQAARTGAVRIEGDGAAFRRWFAGRSKGPGAATIEDAERAITQ
jgi:hypothetical protein